MVDKPTRTLTREQMRRILEQRAGALARPLVSEEAEDAIQFLVLLLGAERYAVDVRSVRETQTLKGLAPIPGTPSFWAGVVNVRGNLYPVLDLRRYLGLTEEVGGDASRKLVLVSGAGITVGVIVDDAPAVEQISAHDVGPPLPGGAEAPHGAVRGVTRDLLTVLDVDALLADARLIVREESN
jgi:purine-binding chemotaxis protein CheW